MLLSDPISRQVDPSAQQGASIRSVERALDLLIELERAGNPMRIADLARATEMPKATVQRLLAVLETRGFVERAQGRFLIGLEALPLSHAFLMASSLTQAALPILRELAAVCEETATLYVRQGFDRIVVQRIEGPHPLRYSMPIGRRLPLLLGAAGRVMAAAMPLHELEQLLDRTGEIHTVTGVPVTREEMLEALDLIRRQGFAVSVDERTIGATSVAAPVPLPGREGTVSVTVTGLTSRVPSERIDPLSIEVRRAAIAIAERCAHL